MIEHPKPTPLHEKIELIRDYYVRDELDREVLTEAAAILKYFKAQAQKLLDHQP